LGLRMMKLKNIERKKERKACVCVCVYRGEACIFHHKLNFTC
jgi:hypothetical protein